MTMEHKEKIDLFAFGRRLTDCKCCILGVYKEQHCYECHEFHMRYAEKVLDPIREATTGRILRTLLSCVKDGGRRRYGYQLLGNL
jgi:hypothetical protein